MELLAWYLLLVGVVAVYAICGALAAGLYTHFEHRDPTNPEVAEDEEVMGTLCWFGWPIAVPIMGIVWLSVRLYKLVHKP